MLGIVAQPRRAPIILAALAVLVGCGDGGNDPVATTRDFLAAVSRRDCERAWTFFSLGTQENVAAQHKKMVRESPYPVQQRAVDLYCEGTYGGAKRRTAHRIAGDGEHAVVAVQFCEGTHFPIIPFLSTPYREWWSNIELVREDGGWKIDRPRAEIGRPGWDQVDVGEIQVSYSRTGNPRRRWVQAEGVVRAPREALEATLMDTQAWARMLPLVTKASVLPGDDSFERRVVLRFEVADGAAAEVPVVVQPYGHLREKGLPWAKLQWVAAESRPGAAARPTIYTGSWELHERHDGFLVTFGLVIQPDEWPSSLADELLGKENVAGVVASLEREAAARTVAAR